MPILKFFRENQLLFVQTVQSRIIIGRSDRCDISLPGPDISRKHCMISPINGEWQLVDHSRHGTYVNGDKVDRCVLNYGSQIQILNYRIDFLDGWSTNQATEEIVESEEHLFIITTDKKVHSYSAELIVVQGDRTVQRLPLMRPRLSVGAKGSDIWIRDPKILHHHCFLRISRGRVMLEPGEGPAFLDGRKVLSITPLYAEEEFRIGDSFLYVERRVNVEEDRTEQFGDSKSSRPRGAGSIFCFFF